MLRNFISSAVNRSLSVTSWQRLTKSEKSPFFHDSPRSYSSGLYKEERERRTNNEDGLGGEPEKLGFLTKASLQKNAFPDENTPNLLFDGVLFKQLPVIIVKSTKNNTKLACHDHAGVLKSYWSSGCENFKNSKKGTSVAAYIMSITFGRKTRKLGVTNARLLLDGFGRGRDAVLKGLKQTGINIVSVTDKTAIPYRGPRPKKVRRV